MTTGRRLTDLKLDAAYEKCTEIARRRAKNFYYAFLALPKPKRDAICAVYAFMRHADDISDDELYTREERRAHLAAWLDSWHEAAAGEASDDPVFLALNDTRQLLRHPSRSARPTRPRHSHGPRTAVAGRRRRQRRSATSPLQQLRHLRDLRGPAPLLLSTSRRSLVWSASASSVIPIHAPNSSPKTPALPSSSPTSCAMSARTWNGAAFICPLKTWTATESTSKTSLPSAKAGR